MATKIPLPILNPELDNPGTAPAKEAAATLRSRAEGGDIMEEIRKETSENKVFLYMKGSPMMPQCGFSSRAVQILNHLNVPFGHANILQDPEKRSAIKEFSEWPTVPQLYVNGEFLGGSDIMMEMFESGELQEALGLK